MDQLAIIEAMGDIPTHFMKSGSCMPPKERLNTLAAFRERIIPEKAYGVPFEYDLWFNTNELTTIIAFLSASIFFLFVNIFWFCNAYYT